MKVCKLISELQKLDPNATVKHLARESFTDEDGEDEIVCYIVKKVSDVITVVKMNDSWVEII